MCNLHVSPLGKAMVFLLCTIFSAIAFWSSSVTLLNWDDLWSVGNYYESYSINKPHSMYQSYTKEAVRLKRLGQWNDSLSYSDQERLSNLTQLLASDATNFRYQVHNQAGTLISDNLNGAPLESAAESLHSYDFFAREGETLHNQDYDSYEVNADGTYQTELYVYTGVGGEGGGFLRCSPPDGPGYNPYGYLADANSRSWDHATYSPEFDTRVNSELFVLEYGIVNPLTVQDAYWSDRASYEQMQIWLPGVAVTAFLTVCISFLLLLLLCRSAGHTLGTEKLHLSWQDRVPLELYLCADILLVTLILCSGDAVAYSFNQYANIVSIVGITLFTVLTVLVLLAGIRTLAVRFKTRSILRNTLSWRVCAILWRIGHTIFGRWSITCRMVCLFLLYLAGTMFTTLTFVLIFPYQAFVLWVLCRWTLQWRAVREGTAHIIGGDPEFKIEATKMFSDLREHAEHLNNLGGAIGSAVDEQMKSERFRAELITNVSHDLKTPLTSIINYVDLLKKENIPNPKALEYIEVLDRKSQRLKKLTEDLVEASKASTGNLTVEKERLGFLQLLTQALGEYEDKFENCALTLVPCLPVDELFVEADGRHLWRVMDNLLGNCIKYALPGTRVYLDVKLWDGTVSLSVKNISRNALNIPPEQLMERFVRGDSSRSSEGSGLGLSIARSLTELQGGRFRLDIDGDLFKAAVTFPEYKEPFSIPAP